MESLAKLLISALEVLEAEMRLIRALWARWFLGLSLAFFSFAVGGLFVAYGGVLWVAPRVGRPTAFALVGALLLGIGAGCCRWALGPKGKKRPF